MYFSFRGLIETGEVDPPSLYNAIKFIEAIITVDELRTAPTYRWNPSEPDVLFTKGICRALSAHSIGDIELRNIFARAIYSAERDLTDPKLQSALNIGSQQSEAARKILNEFAERSQEPYSFMEEYSGAVFNTDKNNSKYQVALHTGLEENAPPERHLAQYLLRTNVAIELAAAQDDSGIAYHPHSHRVRYVVRKFECELERARFSAQHLLHFLGTEVESRNEEIRSGLEGAFGFPGTIEHAPLIMTVLSGVSTPDDILKRALEIRSTNEAMDYRRFVSELLTTFDTGDIGARREAVKNVLDAKALLTAELDRLYGRNTKTALTILPKLVSGAVNELATSALDQNHPDIAVAKALGKVAELSTHDAIQGMRSIPVYVRRRFLRKRIGFLLKLAAEEHGMNTLNGFLRRTFRRDFSPSELSNFSNLYRDPPDAIQH